MMSALPLVVLANTWLVARSSEETAALLLRLEAELLLLLLITALAAEDARSAVGDADALADTAVPADLLERIVVRVALGAAVEGRAGVVVRVALGAAAAAAAGAGALAGLALAAAAFLRDAACSASRISWSSSSCARNDP